MRWSSVRLLGTGASRALRAVASAQRGQGSCPYRALAGARHSILGVQLHAVPVVGVAHGQTHLRKSGSRAAGLVTARVMSRSSLSNAAKAGTRGKQTDKREGRGRRG